MARAAAAEKRTFLPQGLTAVVKRRLVELGGLALAIAGLAIAIACASYSPADPSWNNATPVSPRNLLGLGGAYVADFLLQTVGLGAGVFAAALLSWAWRIASHRGLPYFPLNAAFLPLGILFSSMAAASLARPENWPLVAGLGGYIGDILWTVLQSGMLLAGIELGPRIYQLGLGLAALLALVASLGISRAEWRGLARSMVRLAKIASRPLRRAARALAARRRKEAPERPRASARTRAPEEPRPRREPVMSGPRIERPRTEIRKGRRAESEEQPRLALVPDEGYRFPPLSLLKQPRRAGRTEIVSEDALSQNARLLEGVLEDFGIRGEIIHVRPGPVVTLYELEPAPGIKSSRVIGLSDDIARSMSAISARVSVVPGRNVIGIELPNNEAATVYLRELLSAREFEASEANLALALGKDIGGAPVVVDLERMPHLLIAGTTGSGKSVALNAMILSLVYRLSPAECRLVLIDPKMLELAVYDGIPHLLAPVVTEPQKAILALKWTVREMEDRYKKMSKLGVRNIAGYNLRLGEARAKGEVLKRRVQTGFDSETGAPVMEEQILDLEPLPQIVVVVDEMADLMMVAGKEVEAAIQRLAQMARAAGIHLVMATQRPSVDVITGTIKANFPTRISFQVTSKIDSRTILGEQGAEQLLGQGDMLYMSGGGRIGRIHGPFVSDEEVDRVVAALKAEGAPDYVEGVTEEDGGSLFSGPGGNVADELYDRAVALVAREQRASTSFIQRHLQIGYNRAARIIEEMEAQGIVSRANHVGRREVLIDEH